MLQGTILRTCQFLKEQRAKRKAAKSDEVVEPPVKRSRKDDTKKVLQADMSDVDCPMSVLPLVVNVFLWLLPSDKPVQLLQGTTLKVQKKKPKAMPVEGIPRKEDDFLSQLQQKVELQAEQKKAAEQKKREKLAKKRQEEKERKEQVCGSCTLAVQADKQSVVPVQEKEALGASKASDGVDNEEEQVLPEAEKDDVEGKKLETAQAQKTQKASLVARLLAYKNKGAK